MDREIVSLFLEVLPVCDEQKLIGREMFAIVSWSGTRADFQKKAGKMKRKIDTAARSIINSVGLAIGEPPFAHIRSTIGLNNLP
jgi:hypothetical protein